MDFVVKVGFPRPNVSITYTINAMYLVFKYALNSLCVYITTGILVLIRLHKKADLLETKVNCTKDRKVCADKNML